METNDVINLNDYRKVRSMVIHDTEGKITHVISVEQLEQIARGELDFTDIHNGDSLQRAIIKEWLSFFK